MKKIYISYPMNKDKHDLKLIQQVSLENPDCFICVPPIGQLENKTLGAKFDKQMIDLCDEVWAFGQLGRDCSWEIGYAAGLGKKVKIFIDNKNRELIKDDWMLFLGAEIIDRGQL